MGHAVRGRSVCSVTGLCGKRGAGKPGGIEASSASVRECLRCKGTGRHGGLCSSGLSELEFPENRILPPRPDSTSGEAVSGNLNGGWPERALRNVKSRSLPLFSRGHVRTFCCPSAETVVPDGNSGCLHPATVRNGRDREKEHGDGAVLLTGEGWRMFWKGTSSRGMLFEIILKK